MSFTIVAGAFINQQMPSSEQIGVAKIHDSNTNKHKYRMRYLPAEQFGKSFREDVIEVHKTGSKIPDSLGEAFINELGEDCVIPCP